MKKQLLDKLSTCLHRYRSSFSGAKPVGMTVIVASLLFSASANAQNVNIPDSVFKSKLLNNININTNGDAEIQVSEAANFNGLLNVGRVLITPPGGGPPVLVGPAISDLTGIEAFTSLTGLNCSRNSLSSLDLSANHALIELNSSYNTLTAGLNVSLNTALTELDCSYNQLTNLNISVNTALTILKCAGNQLTSLNISSNTGLTWLYCPTNQLTNLNVSTNTALTNLYFNQNQLTTLDVSDNVALTVLGCGSNLLTSLIMNNGNNSNITYFDAINNPFLTCIQVDNVGYSNANWNFIDSIASFSTNCGVTSVFDTDESTIMQLFPNPAGNHLTIALGSSNKNVQVTIADVTGKTIYKTTATDLQTLEVNTTDFLKGIYIVRIQAADFSLTKKLVIEK